MLHIMTCNQIVCCVLLLSKIGMASDGKVAQALTPIKQPFATDFICGPRCLLEVLRRLDHQGNTDLVELVREVQWPNISDGTSLQALAEAARTRGLVAELRHLDAASLSELEWDYPCIVHTRPSGLATKEDGSRAGHFIFLDIKSSSSSQASLFHGLSGEARILWGDLEGVATGHILLFSVGEPIPHQLPARVSNSYARLAGGVLISLALSGLAWKLGRPILRVVK